MIEYKNKVYSKVLKFDCVNLEFSNGNGSKISETLPISLPEERAKQTLELKKKFPDKVIVQHFKDYTQFKIVDDNRNVSIVKLSNEHQKEIETAIQLARERYGLEVREN